MSAAELYGPVPWCGPGLGDPWFIRIGRVAIYEYYLLYRNLTNCTSLTAASVFNSFNSSWSSLINFFRCSCQTSLSCLTCSFWYLSSVTVDSLNQSGVKTNFSYHMLAYTKVTSSVHTLADCWLQEKRLLRRFPWFGVWYTWSVNTWTISSNIRQI